MKKRPTITSCLIQLGLMSLSSSYIVFFTFSQKFVVVRSARAPLHFNYITIVTILNRYNVLKVKKTSLFQSVHYCFCFFYINKAKSSVKKLAIFLCIIDYLSLFETKSEIRVKVPPTQCELSISSGTFLNNYDVINRKL